MYFRKTGFTLVELLVVIAIIGILASALVFQVTKAGDSARAMRCRANLKNLAQAALSYGAENRWLPFAGSFEDVVISITENDAIPLYFERTGWVNWTGRSKGKFREPHPGQTAKQCAAGRSYRNDPAFFSITNGTLWYLTGKNLDVYSCDVHRKVSRQNGYPHVLRSYVMNSYFGFDNRGENATHAPFRGIGVMGLSSKGNAGNLLLFSEMPIFKPNSGTPRQVDVKGEYNAGGPCWADGVLETHIHGYSSKRREYIGFNHLVAKRYVAHVAFADGHVDALVEPRGATVQELEDLTEDLCNGYEVEEEIRKKMH